jgi:primosomal protein N' (replication factor Y)
MPQFAEVAVNQTIRGSGDSSAAVPDVFRPSAKGAFHYRIPAHLAEKLAVGQMVWVPFGPQRLQGVILQFSDESPVADVKDIEGIVDLEPALSPQQVALARWVSDYYLCPLSDAVGLMLPPGISQRLYTQVSAKSAPPWPNSLTDEQRALLDYLVQKGPRRLRGLRRKFKVGRLHNDLRKLERVGLVDRQAILSEPRTQPLRARFARLAATDKEIELALPRMGRSTQASRLLGFLAHSEQPVWPLDEACERAGSSPEAAKSLAKDGCVAIQPKMQVVVLVHSGAALEEALAELVTRSISQTAILERLRDKGGTEDAAILRRDGTISAAALRALEKKGLLRRVAEEALIHLSVSRDEALERVLELQGTVKYRSILSVLHQAKEPVWLSWLYAETDCTLDDVRALVEQGLVALGEEEVQRTPLTEQVLPAEEPPALTPDQEQVWVGVRETMQVGGQTVLLHGVTGSGKTEIYLRALAETLKAGKQAIILVPEISLTPQTVQRFSARFPDQVAVLHSSLSDGERFDQWRAVRAGRYSVVVGARSALFAPARRLGLIVLDEEHEPSYKQDRTPRYHARDVAVQLANLTGATVILGSATPDLVTYSLAQQGRYHLLQLPQRILWNRQRLERERVRLAGKPVSARMEGPVAYSDLPHVEVVDLRKELLEGNRTIFSRALQAALRETLNAGQQAILFLNRRGSASFVMCRDCGHVMACGRCELPLTYHSTTSNLVCHHCNRREPMPKTCPACGGARIRYFGLGTQRVEEVAQEMFPSARTLRWDRDATRHRSAYDELLGHFIRGRADVLIGTQMIAKGLDLPRVTLVGVISADTSLYLPDFRAGERTFQLLTQVAGRAGRSVLGGRVIVQTYTPQQPSIQAASRHDYVGFYEDEIPFRREHGYPPFSRMARLLYVDTSLRRCREEGVRMREYLDDRVRRLGLPWVEITGPAPCFLPRLRGRFQWHIVIRTDDPYPLLANLAYDLKWRVDVDPVDFV